MSKLRSVNTAFWSDPFIEECTPTEKLLFLYFITNEKTNMLGVYEASLSKMSFETGINKDIIEKALKRFEEVGKVKYIGTYVLLINYARHQNYNPNMKKSAIDVFNNLPPKIKGDLQCVDKEDVAKGFERVLNHLGMVRKVEVEREVEIENENEDIGEEENKPIPLKPTSKDRLALFIDKFNEIRGTKYKPNKNLLKNFEFWLEVYSPKEILQAVENCKGDHWLNDGLSPQKLLRQGNKNGDADYIGELLNYKPKRQNTAML